MTTYLDPSADSALESPPEERLIDIDFPALIRLLSDHLYREPKQAVIRELLTNANDSLRNRSRFDGFANDSPEIRIWLTAGASHLCVIDNGIGMSKDDLINYLSRIGASLTREVSQQTAGAQQGFDSSIGKYGVGFLSSFVVATKIVVTTRKAEQPGYCWSSEGGQGYTIRPCEGLPQGTSVLLELKPEVVHEWNEPLLKRVVLETAGCLDYPIFWGESGTDQINMLRAPWYEDHAPEDRDLEAYRNFLVHYRSDFESAGSATEIIPLHAKEIRGAVYIPPPSAMSMERLGVADVFCKRMFVVKNHQDIIPEEFRFTKGVVDCYEFQLNAARDDFFREHAYFKVRAYIGRQILDRFRSLANQAGPGSAGEQRAEAMSELARMRLQALMSHCNLWLKNALVLSDVHGNYTWDDEYLTVLEEFMPFRSSSGGFTSIPEYLRRQIESGRNKRLVYIPCRSDNAESMIQVALQHKQEVLIPTPQFPVEEEYLRRYARLKGIPCESAEDVLGSELPKLPVEGGWSSIVNYFQLQLNHPELSLSVYLSEFDSDLLPGRILADTKSEGQRQFDALVEELENAKDLSKDDPLLRQLALMKQKRPHSLYLNKRHAVLSQLAESIHADRNNDIEPILHAMFHDISVASGHPVHEGHLVEYQNKLYAAAFERASAQSQLGNMNNQLSEEKRRNREVQEQSTQLRKELSVFQDQANVGLDTLAQVFFIRPMRDGFDDTISRKVEDICRSLELEFIDPKKVNIPGNILSQITTHLRQSRFVIADISETNNANVYYEAGFAEGTLPQKLILIVDQRVKDSRELPFDFLTQRVISYSQEVEGFDRFLDELKRTLSEMVARQRET